MTKRLALLFVVALALATGCSSGGSEGAPSTEAEPTSSSVDGGSSDDRPDAREDPEGSTSSGDGTGGCDGYDVADEAVVSANCDGTATVRFTIDGEAHEITGGTCERFGDFFNVNAGVQLFPGADQVEVPDSATLVLPLADGPFDLGVDDLDLVIGMTVDGVAYGLDEGSGSHDADSATFEGVESLPGEPDTVIAGTVTC